MGDLRPQTSDLRPQTSHPGLIAPAMLSTTRTADTDYITRTPYPLKGTRNIKSAAWWASLQKLGIH